VKIVQILITPNNQEYQGILLGLCDEGNVYQATPTGWAMHLECKLENGGSNGNPVASDGSEN
jgi:hypothetical protein